MNIEELQSLLREEGSAYRARYARAEVPAHVDARIRARIGALLEQSRSPQPALTLRPFFATLESGLQQILALRPAVAVVALFVFVIGAAVSIEPARTVVASLLTDDNVAAPGDAHDIAIVQETPAAVAVSVPVETEHDTAPVVVRVVTRRSAADQQIAYAPSVGPSINYAPSVHDKYAPSVR
jgi:hypothetical protein